MPNKTYCGQTNHLILRFHQHNNPDNKGYTGKFQPWVVIHCEYFSSRSEAMKKEKWFKSEIGRRQTRR